MKFNYLFCLCFVLMKYSATSDDGEPSEANTSTTKTKIESEPDEPVVGREREMDPGSSSKPNQVTEKGPSNKIQSSSRVDDIERDPDLNDSLSNRSETMTEDALVIDKQSVMEVEDITKGRGKGESTHAITTSSEEMTTSVTEETIGRVNSPSTKLSKLGHISKEKGSTSGSPSSSSILPRVPEIEPEIIEEEASSSGSSPIFRRVSEIEPVVEQKARVNTHSLPSIPEMEPEDEENFIKTSIKSQAKDRTRSLIRAEKFCVSTNSAEYAELLLGYDIELRSPNRNWWVTEPSLLFGGGGEMQTQPRCSKNPHLKAMSSYKISAHEFFQSRKIDIPIKFGRVGHRYIEFRYRDTSIVMWNVHLECECEVLRTEKDTTKVIDDNENICKDGIVSLSRGVGGDNSFFVYTMNPLNGCYNVRAHICIE